MIYFEYGSGQLCKWFDTEYQFKIDSSNGSKFEKQLGQKFPKIRHWLDNNAKSDVLIYCYHSWYICFESKADALLFKLTWL